MVKPVLVYWTANFILYLFWSFSVSCLCERRFSRGITFLIDIVSANVMIVLTTMLQSLSLLRLVVGVAYFVLVMMLLHKGKRLYVFLVSFIIINTMSVAEVIALATMPIQAAFSGELSEKTAIPIYAAYLFLSAVILLITVVVIDHLMKRRQNRNHSRIWLLLPIYPICQMITLAVLFNLYAKVGSSFGTVFWLVIVFVITDILMFIAMQAAAKNTDLSIRNEILEEQVNTETAYYAQLAESYEDIRKMRHDIDNHLFTMKALLREGQIEEAEEYTRQITERDSAKEHFPGCLNTVAAAYLEKKAADFETYGIPFTADIHIPGELRITNPDLICVFGNLLDNAQEACNNQAEPVIELSASYKEPYLTIHCRNPIESNEKNAAPGQKRRRIPELNRGVGFTILEQLAKRYDGEFSTEMQGDIFHADIIMKG